MKKTIVILILVVFVASIAIVNLFGLQPTIHDGTIYVTEIKCETITLLNGENKEIQPFAHNEEGAPIFIFKFEKPSATENLNVVQLNIEVLPNNANEKGYTFEYDDEAYSGELVYNAERGAFVVLVPYSIFYITIRATDGSNTTTKVGFVGFEAEIYDEIFK